MKVYAAVFRMRFVAGLQYRAAALGGLATQFAWGLMQLLAFAAFYRANPAAFPMTYQQTASYIWLQQALLALFMTWFFDADIFDAILSGAIAYELARPVDLYNRWFCQSAATRVAKAVLRCAPVLLVAFLVPGDMRLMLPPNMGQFLLFLLSMVLGLGVVVSFVMLIYISCFFTLSAYGMRVMAAALADFFAGAIIPLPFFPEGIRQVAQLLPFASMQNAPLRLWVGHITGWEAAGTIALQAFWLAAMAALGRRLMRRALSRVIVQGG